MPPNYKLTFWSIPKIRNVSDVCSHIARATVYLITAVLTLLLRGRATC